MKTLILALTLGLALPNTPQPQPHPHENLIRLAQADPDNEKREPFKIFDNLYYVGMNWVAAYVLETSDGLILIDTLYGDYVDHLLDSMKKLGLDPKDIKYILSTHAHFDHLGGAKQIQDLSGARVGMVQGDWDMMKASPTTGRYGFEHLPVDWVIKDGETLTLGEQTLTFYATPGHTPGVLSTQFTVYDNGAPHKAFMFGGVGLNFRGVDRTEMYIDSVKRLQAMTGIEVNIPNHASMGKVFQRAERLDDRKPRDPHPFVAPDDFTQWLDELLINGEKKLTREKAATKKK